MALHIYNIYIYIYIHTYIMAIPICLIPVFPRSWFRYDWYWMTIISQAACVLYRMITSCRSYQYIYIYLYIYTYIYCICNVYLMVTSLAPGQSYNIPVSQIPQYTSPISYNAPFCSRNVRTCTCMIQNGTLQDIFLMHCGICEIGLLFHNQGNSQINIYIYIYIYTSIN